MGIVYLALITFGYFFILVYHKTTSQPQRRSWFPLEAFIAFYSQTISHKFKFEFFEF